jgi:signal transduction histidine kinase
VGIDILREKGRGNIDGIICKCCEGGGWEKIRWENTSSARFSNEPL